MLGIAITILIFNIFFLVVFYVKLQRRFSNKAEIENVKKEVYNLISNIAFQTEQSVTIIEDKLNAINSAIAELDKRILLAKNEEQKRKQAEQTLQNVINYKNPVITNAPKTKEKDDTSLSKIEKIKEIEKPKMVSAETSGPIKIYTKQILSSASRSAAEEKFFREQIIEMARKGLSVEFIAEKVPLPLGEIELIVSMNV